MKNKIFFSFIRARIILLGVVLGLYGCGTLHITPTEETVAWIQADVPKDQLLTGVSIAFENQDRDSSEDKVTTPNANDNSVRANRRVWSEMLIELLKTGIKNRDGQIVEKSSIVVSVSLPEIRIAALPAVMKFSVTVNVDVGPDWKKTYIGEGAASGWESFGGPTSLLTKAANRSLSAAAYIILTDKEFLSVLKRGK